MQPMNMPFDSDPKAVDSFVPSHLDEIEPSTTGLIHHAYAPPQGFDAPMPGVFKASTIFFPDVAAMREREWKDKSGYTYGLHGTPTTFILEERIAALEGGEQCVLFPSGLAAISSTSLALLRHGDEVLIPDNAYGPNKHMAQTVLRQYGITHQFYDPMNSQDLAGRINEKTKLVWLEAPGSVTLEFPDLIALVQVCRERQVLTALDNTWGAGLAFCAFDLLGDGALGVDLSVHALTKYPSGGGDLLMGSVVTREHAIHLRIKLWHMHLGLGIGGNEAEIMLRSLPSIALRYAAHDQSTRILAQWMERRHAVIAQVLHPSLPDSPGHANWMRLCGAKGQGMGSAAGLFSIVIRPQYTQAQVDAFCNRLRLFRLGYSWGGPVSLVVPYDIAQMRDMPNPDLQEGSIVRFSVGLEAVQDLQKDLEQAMAQAFHV